MTREDRITPVKVELGDEEREAVAAVLATGNLVQGEQVAAFEEEFRAVVGGRDCTAVNSGTSALHVGLLACGIGPGDEVVVPSFTFAATANAVVRAGATPVFADIDPDTFNLDPRAVERVLSPATRAIMPVHLYGQPADMTAFRDLSDDRGLLLLEDACQAHAAQWRDIPAGAWGDVAAFSFYATKNMTTGEGGMIVCQDPETSRRARLIRNQGMEVRYQNELAGLNNRMTDIAAAIGRVQLKRLDGWTRRRREIAAAYDAGLTDLPGLRIPSVAEGARHAYHQYTVRSSARDALLAALDERGVGAVVYYPVPTHHLPAYRSASDLPVTDRAAAEVLSLPIRPGLTNDEVDRVIQTVRDVVPTLPGGTHD